MAKKKKKKNSQRGWIGGYFSKNSGQAQSVMQQTHVAFGHTPSSLYGGAIPHFGFLV